MAGIPLVKAPARTVVLLTDRSRTIDYQECHRKRFLGYHFPVPLPSSNTPFGSVGIRPSRENIYLHDGICVHHGLALLRTGKNVEEAVRESLALYWKVVREAGLKLEPDDDPDYVGKEQAALIEACLRAYALVRLPELLKKFEVLEVEQEDLFPLGEFTIPGVLRTQVPPGVNAHDPNQANRLVVVENTGDVRYVIGWQSRCDALLLERETGDLFIQSDKTAAYWGDKVDKQNQHDMQGLSEVAAVEVRLEKWWQIVQDARRNGSKVTYHLHPRMYELLAEAPAPPKIQGVRMEFILKGKRSKDKDGEGPRLQRSPLVRGWVNRGVTPGTDQYAWSWNWRDEMGKKKALNWQNWKSFPAWELPGGIKRWVEEMLAPDAMGYSYVQREAGSCLEQQFVCPMPYFRQDVDMADWYQQTRCQEEEVHQRLVCLQDAIQELGWEAQEVRTLLNRWFPQYRRSCDWPDACEFQDVCFSVAVGRDPIGSGLYRPRVPHHQPEVEQQSGKNVTVE